jgi:hypothetical protein
MREMQIFQMKFSEHAMNFGTSQKLVTKQNCESHAHNHPFREEKCALKGTENIRARIKETTMCRILRIKTFAPRERQSPCFLSTMKI